MTEEASSLEFLHSNGSWEEKIASIKLDESEAQKTGTPEASEHTPELQLLRDNTVARALAYGKRESTGKLFHRQRLTTTYATDDAAKSVYGIFTNGRVVTKDGKKELDFGNQEPFVEVRYKRQDYSYRAVFYLQTGEVESGNEGNGGPGMVQRIAQQLPQAKVATRQQFLQM